MVDGFTIVQLVKYVSTIRFIYRFDLAAVNQFANQIARSMRISVMIEDGLITFSWDDQMLEFPMEIIHDNEQ